MNYFMRVLNFFFRPLWIAMELEEFASIIGRTVGFSFSGYSESSWTLGSSTTTSNVFLLSLISFNLRMRANCIIIQALSDDVIVIYFDQTMSSSRVDVL